MSSLIANIGLVMQAIWSWLGDLTSALFGTPAEGSIAGTLQNLGFLILICFGLFIVYRVISYVKSLIHGY